MYFTLAVTIVLYIFSFSDFFKGLDCVAEKLAPNRSDECFKKMIAFVKEDPSSIVKQIEGLLKSSGITIHLRFGKEVGQCNIYKGNGA